jgi:hypothetical protein
MDNPAGTPPTFYYPQRPWEEARLTVPAGAPALPSGMYLSGLTVAQINAGATTGINFTPPEAGFCYAPGLPWITWTNEIACVAGAGRFACEYNDPENVCVHEVEFEP